MGREVPPKPIVLTIRGGVDQTPMHVQLPRGQSIHHHGATVTLWSGMLTPDEHHAVVQTLTDMGVHISVHEPLYDNHPTSLPNTLPTQYCHSCAWLDEGFRCGAQTWHPTVVREFNVGKAETDLRNCPLLKDLGDEAV